jgi:hypothetical protein
MTSQSQLRANKKYRQNNKEKFREYTKKYYYKNRAYNIQKSKINEKKNRWKYRKKKYCDTMKNVGLYWAEYIDFHKCNISIKEIRNYINENINLYLTFNDFLDHKKKFDKCLDELKNNYPKNG